MKKALISISIIIIILAGMLVLYSKNVYASEAIDNKTESNLIQIKEKQVKTLEQYTEKYGSQAYGLTAYILHKIQVYSIPFCFLGILVGGIWNYVLGIRHLEAQEKGLAMMVSFVTLTIICQVLPLVFTIVVKFRRK